VDISGPIRDLNNYLQGHPKGNLTLYFSWVLDASDQKTHYATAKFYGRVIGFGRGRSIGKAKNDAASNALRLLYLMDIEDFASVENLDPLIRLCDYLRGHPMGGGDLTPYFSWALGQEGRGNQRTHYATAKINSWDIGFGRGHCIGKAKNDAARNALRFLNLMNIKEDLVANLDPFIRLYNYLRGHPMAGGDLTAYFSWALSQEGPDHQRTHYATAKGEPISILSS